MIKILIVDDHPIVREGLSQIIINAGPEKYDVVGTEENLSGALFAIRNSKPDVMIVDICLKGSDGIELIKCVRSGKSEADINILVLSMHDENIYAERAIRAGADGYIMKHEGASELCKAIDTVARGGVYLSDRMTTKLLRARARNNKNKQKMLIDTLTDRELEVLSLLGTGLTTTEVALDLHLSIKTVETYCTRIKEKIHISNFNQLIMHAVQWVNFNAGNSSA